MRQTHLFLVVVELMVQIHSAAGDGLYEECKTLGGCETGSAKITSGHDLPSKFVIHAVGPDYDNYDDRPDEAERLLAGCYSTSLQLAEDNGVSTIAFPAISTGIFNYPKEEASRIVHKVVDEFKTHAKSVKEIRFVLWSDEDLEIYQREFSSK